VTACVYFKALNINVVGLCCGWHAVKSKRIEKCLKL
jgi:putative component of toxin-antitoxin plasmid stabilization module